MYYALFFLGMSKYFFEDEDALYLQEMTPDFVHFMITSEENTYGLAAGNGFFDGHVDSEFCDPVGRNYGGLIKITEVYENLNLPPKCSQNSYYQCMAKIL